MSAQTIEITVGDTGITLSGQLNGGSLTTLAGSTVTLDIIRVDGVAGNLVTGAAATITNAATRMVACKLTNAVALAGIGKVRWNVTLPNAGGVVHFPGPDDQQVWLKINA